MIVVNYFHSKWASARGINRDIGQKTKTELDANLRLFYTDNTATNYEKLGGMYQRAHQNDGFIALRLDCSRLNPAHNAFFSFRSDSGRGQKNQCSSKSLKAVEKAQQSEQSLSSLYQSLHQGNSCNTLVGC